MQQQPEKSSTPSTKPQLHQPSTESTKNPKRRHKHQSGPAKKRQRNQSGGVTKHGSYRQYYNRRLGEQGAEDDRLPLLRADWLTNSTTGRILDIGCNDGTFTLEVARRFPNANVLGVELDRALVGKARKALRIEAVEKKASMPMANSRPIAIGEQPGDGGKQVKQSEKIEPKLKSEQFTPISCHVVQGLMPETVADAPKTEQESSLKQTDVLTNPEAGGNQPVQEEPPVEFPFNLTYRAEDFAAEIPGRTALETGSFDVALCLSVTKWVHMRGGDVALKRLFARLRDSLRPGGVLVLEPQLKRSYKIARLKGAVENAPTFAELKMKPTMFKDYLLGKEGGFGSMEMLRDVRERGQAFNRPVMAFFKKKHTIEEESKSVV